MGRAPTVRSCAPLFLHLAISLWAVLIGHDQKTTSRWEQEDEK
jgi:hypothetical protein